MGWHGANWGRIGKSVRWPVSRVLSSPEGDGWPFIWDARYRTPHATDPDDNAEMRLTDNDLPVRRPYLVLLPVGFTVPLLLPVARCALTAPFHPYRPADRSVGRRFAFCGTFPRVAPAGRYPAPYFRGARTFLSLGYPEKRPSGHLTRRDPRQSERPAQGQL